MKYLSIAITLLAILNSCTQEYLFSPTDSTVSIVGNLSVPFQDNTARGIRSNYLPDGSCISFYSSGGISADNLLLTYEKEGWNFPTELQWNPERSEATVTAYYPYIERDFCPYEKNGSLKDILYSTGIFKYQSPITLQFNHIFSQLIFQVNARLNSHLEQISFTPSISINNIDWRHAQLTYTSDKLHTQKFTKQENGIYKLIVPPASNISVNITLKTSEGNYTAQLTPTTFQRGYQYKYNLKSNNECGISTAEDFIAFTHLINGEVYSNRTLDEFGTSNNGNWTYYLLNDIYFTPEQCERLQPIGRIESQEASYMGFKDCLDGQNHSLYNLYLTPKEEMDSYALFSCIDTTGIVKDLNIINASFTGSHICKYEAILAGRNNGTIIGCHIKGNNTFVEMNDNKPGGMIGINKGCIINSSSENIDFQHPNGKVGGISYSNSGKILNCYTSECNFLHTQAGAGICYTMEPRSEMKNCYAFTTAGYPSKKKYAALVYSANNCIIECGLSCDDDIKTVYGSYQATLKEIYTYDAQTMKTQNGILVMDILNNWIENNASLYPQYTFYDWITGDTPPIIIQQP